MKKKSFQDMITKLSKLEEEIKNLDNIITNLTKDINNQNIIYLLKEENNKLEASHKLSQVDIQNFKEEMDKLIQKQKNNEEEIKKLKQQNEELKKGKNIVPKENKINNLICSIKDLRERGFFLFQSNNFDEEEIKNEIENEIKIEAKTDIKPTTDGNNLEQMDLKKKEFELNFHELKEKSNQFYKDLEEKKNIIDNYKNYLNDIGKQINSFNEKLSISDNNNVIIDNSDIPNKKEQNVNKQISMISDLISQLNEIYLNTKNYFTENIEHLLKEISNNIILIDKKKYKNEDEHINIYNNIEHKIEEIQSFCYIYEEKEKELNDFNSNIDQKIQQLKDLYEKYQKESKNININNGKNIENINNNNLNIEEPDIEINPNINNYIDNDVKNLSLKDSFLFEIKNKNKIDSFKTKILFKKKKKDNIDYNFDEAKILRKNWHEICYIYDDYNLHDIYYEIKAVGLNKNFCFTSCLHSFLNNKKINIQSFLVNDTKYNYIKRNNSIEFKIKLLNLQEAKIHIIYKEKEDLSKLSKGEIKLRKIFRNENYGLDNILSGQMSKYILIIKGDFEIVNFSNYFLIKNEKNVNDIEYVWGGRVPEGGLKTNIMLSKKEASWSFNLSTKIRSDYHIKNTTFLVPVEFIGGNNEIVNITPSSSNTKKINLNEIERQYVINYKNTKCKEVDFIIKGELINKCKGEWLVDLTDEQIEKNIPEDVVLCKSQLYEIGKKIIEEFDKKNKKSDYIFVDFMKIGMWVHENIKYDLRYIEKTDYTAIDIYNKRRGVCHHFTKLSNALLYSLGYKVISVYGYYCENDIKFNENSSHSWSLIKINNKWYPFDSTWGIFSGKLPVIHVFGVFNDKIRETQGIDDVRIENEIIIGKYIS